MIIIFVVVIISVLSTPDTNVVTGFRCLRDDDIRIRKCDVLAEYYRLPCPTHELYWMTATATAYDGDDWRL